MIPEVKVVILSWPDSSIHTIVVVSHHHFRITQITEQFMTFQYMTTITTLTIMNDYTDHPDHSGHPDSLTEWLCQPLFDFGTYAIATQAIGCQRVTQETCDLWDIWSM